jgi:hypothetical protein
MLKRRLISLAVVLAVAAGGTAVAQAAVPKGTYAGKFSDGGRVSLTVKSQKLIKIVRSSLLFRCTDGDRFRSLKVTATGDVDVADGDFDIADTTQADGVTWSMKGKFSTKKRKVKGTYEETRTFNERNELDPDGTITCQTGDLTYSAVLPKKKK